MAFPVQLRFLAAAAVAFSLAGCGDSNVKESRGPVEGKRLDGSQTALKVPDPATVVPATPGTPDKVVTPETGKTDPPAVSDADAKKKRDEWRDKKAGRPDPNDPLAKANIELRPSLDPDAKKPAPKVETPAVKDPAVKDPAKPADPTVVGKSLVDPTAPVPFVDPNNPNFVPADRTLWKKFDIKNLKEVDGHLAVSFADLSGFPYSGQFGAPKLEKGKEPPKPEHQIPDGIKALSGKKVVVSGYMSPIDFEDGRTNEFVLTRVIPSCLYCIPPQLNDWVEVKMADGKRVPYVFDGIVELYGTIEVKEFNEDGFVVCLFRMTGTKVVPAVVE